MVSKASSVEYSHHMDIQSNDLNWANKADAEIFHIPLSPQAREKSNNQVPANMNSNGPITRVDLTNTMLPNQDINRLSLPTLSYESIFGENLGFYR